MVPEFWKSRWEAGQIRFHEGRPNSLLVRHADRLGRARRVLVPLAGKSVDVAYLASLGHEVVAVELVESAVETFFREQGLSPTVDRTGPLTRYEAGPITFFAGDYFATTRAHLGEVNALYDRAALIALPEPMRAAYAPHTLGLLIPDFHGLLVSIEYDLTQRTTPPPPHPVFEDEIRRLFNPAGASERRKIELLEEIDGLTEANRQQGLTVLREKAWWLAPAGANESSG
jgi:thiopurine S-methyltransferase